MTGSFARGLAAGAAGTTVLNAVSYLDMVWRGRPASSTPEGVVDAAVDAAGTQLPGSAEQRQARRTALGALAGIGNGLATGVAASVLRSRGVRFSPAVGALLTGATAMAATDVPAAVLGVADPRSWAPADWAADVVPHLAYGAAVQAVLEAVPNRREGVVRLPAGGGLVLRSGLLGVASGCRSSLGFAAPTLAAPSQPGGPGVRGAAARVGALGSVIAELVGDKQPGTPNRTSPAGLPVRFLSATTGAARLATRQRANGAVPLVAAALGAAAGSWGGLGWRRWAVGRMPDLQAALLEDAVALLLAVLACRPDRAHAVS